MQEGQCEGNVEAPQPTAASGVLTAGEGKYRFGCSSRGAH